MYQAAESAATIGHINLKAFTGKHEVKQPCTHAVQCGFQPAGANAVRTPECREYPGGSGIPIGTAAAFSPSPLSIKINIQEATAMMEAKAQ